MTCARWSVPTLHRYAAARPVAGTHAAAIGLL